MPSDKKEVSLQTPPRRTRQQTETLRHIEINRNAAFHDVKTYMNQIRLSTDKEKIAELQALYIGAYRTFKHEHEQFCELLSHDELQEYLDDWFGPKDKLIVEFQLFLENLMKEIVVDPQPEITPQDSISQTSTHTSGSNSRQSVAESNVTTISTMRIKQQQANAEIELRKRKLLERQKFAREKLELQFREEQFELNTEAEVAAVKTKIIDETIQQSGSLNPTFALKPSPTLNPNARNFNPTFPVNFDPTTPSPQNHNPNTLGADTNYNNPTTDNTTKTLVQNMKKPQIKLKSFSGEPSDYKRFIRAFESKILPFTINDDERMNYLDQYTEGQANRIVRGYSYLDAIIGYGAAMKELEERYGNSEIIAKDFCVKALEHKPVSKSKDIDEFGILLQECFYAIKSIEAMKILEYPDNITRIVQKLPFYLHERWRDLIEDTRLENKPIDFALLVKFVKREARKCMDPIFGKDAMAQVSTNKPSVATNNKTNQKPKLALATQVTKKTDTDTPSKDFRCLHCKANHKIENCTEFKGKPHYEKLEILRKAGYCFGCLNKGHMKSDCKKKHQCTKCEYKHPTLLHIDPAEYKQLQKADDTEHLSVKAHALTRAGDNYKYDCTMAIVPVKVKKQNGLQTINTFAFLDPGSSVTFCTQRLMQKLGLQGKYTKLTLDTMTDSKTISSYRVDNLEVYNYDLDDSITIHRCYSKERIPVDIGHIPTKEDIMKWPHLNKIDIPETDLDCNIDLMIGNNIPDAYTPYETATGPRGTPHATRTAIGWILWNVLREATTDTRRRNVVNRVDVQHILELEKLNELDKLVHQQILNDFPERTIDDKSELSQRDKQFFEKVDNSVRLVDGKYEIALPFKDKDIELPDNEYMVTKRLHYLEKKMTKNTKFKTEYTEFMNSVLNDGYAEQVPCNEIDVQKSRKWFIPHHGVYHKQKQKIRTVFDCSARCNGVSINDVLLSGPDLTNNLVGVLMKFRIGIIGLISDIKSMFHQVKVPLEDRDSLRFFWWPEGNLEEDVKQYRMTSHLFGAVSSPSVANYALQKIAKDFADRFSDSVTQTILDNFYVDDCLRSIDDEREAITLVNDLMEICKLGGFRLHKWISNSPSVLETIPESERANQTTTSLGQDESIIERALGVSWNVCSDSLTFKINIQDQPYTRRGLLSIISSIFDPLGLAAPAMLYPKILLQELCQKGMSWDQPIDDVQKRKWCKFLKELPILENLHLPRCVKPDKIEDVVSTQLHTFSDASLTGYGVCSYLRFVNKSGTVTCNLLIGKSRVTPTKRITIPRLELTAATVAVKLTKKITNILKIDIEDIFYWTDSTTVLGYIANESTRFQTFVSNRVSLIREATTLNQWRKVGTEENPADDASRGLSINALVEKKRWFNGPDFLRQTEEFWPENFVPGTISSNDPEIKKVNATIVEEPFDTIDSFLSYYSDYNKLRKSISWILRLKDLLLEKIRKNVTGEKPKLMLCDEDFRRSEKYLIIHEQQKYLKVCFEACSNTNQKKKKLGNDLAKLDPFIDEEGALRVGGRLKMSDLSLDAKHQLILPKESRLSEIIIRHTHSLIGHLGKNAILSQLRKRYWIIGASKIIKSLIARCVICRRNLAKTNQQQMADLPLNRITPNESPFTHTGLDFFGPYEVRFKRSSLKRYGAIFTCFNSRAVHLEIVTSMDTDSCINCIRRFISRRGLPKTIRSDNGSNIVGAVNELKTSLNELNQRKINDELAQKGIKWEFNPPAASNFGGVWERIIRTVRKVLNSLLKEHNLRLDDETLSTLFCEVESILNSRPLTRISETPDDLDAITPNHLLQVSSRSNLSPAVTTKTDLYVRRRWKQVQCLTDMFWRRWISEYLPCLQERQKWLYPARNIVENDIVLVLDNRIRNSWTLARVLEVFPDRKGVVRIAKLKTQSTTLERPVNKLWVLLEADE